MLDGGWVTVVSYIDTRTLSRRIVHDHIATFQVNLLTGAWRYKFYGANRYSYSGYVGIKRWVEDVNWRESIKLAA